jgi:hypothetical protein
MAGRLWHETPRCVCQYPGRGCLCCSDEFKHGNPTNFTVGCCSFAQLVESHVETPTRLGGKEEAKRPKTAG